MVFLSCFHWFAHGSPRSARNWNPSRQTNISVDEWRPSCGTGELLFRLRKQLYKLGPSRAACLDATDLLPFLGVVVIAAVDGNSGHVLVTKLLDNAWTWSRGDNCITKVPGQAIRRQNLVWLTGKQDPFLPESNLKNFHLISCPNGEFCSIN